MTVTDTRTRILEAAVACVERWGLAKTSLEDVANEAGLSRATVYRHFAGGRDELVAETIGWEVAKYLGRLAEAIEPEQGIEAKLGLLDAGATDGNPGWLRQKFGELGVIQFEDWVDTGEEYEAFALTDDDTRSA